MLSWLKRRKWLVANAILVGVLVSLLGIQVVDKGDAVDHSVKIDIGEEKVITLGHIAYAAGSVDYTYDGTDDDVQFQAALDALPATGGRLVVVSAVQISFSSTVSRAIDNVIIEGSGDGTYFVNDSATAIFDVGTQDGWQFRNFRTDAGFIDVDSTTDYIIENVTNDTTLVGKAVRTSTLVVTASNATDTVKAQADYVCDGTADQVEIQAAIDALPSGGGKVVLGEGTFNLNAAVELVTGQDDITIEGNKAVLTMSSSPTEALTSDSGIGTSIEVADSSGFSVGQDVWIRSDTYYENDSDYRTISAIPDSTTITIDSNTGRDWQTSDNAKIVGLCRYINVQDATESDYVKNTTIRGLIFDGNESTVSIKGSWYVPMLRLRCTEGTLVSDCRFRNSDTPAVVLSQTSTILADCFFDNFKAADAVNGYDVIHLATGQNNRSILRSLVMLDIEADNGVFLCQQADDVIISDLQMVCGTSCVNAIDISNSNDNRAQIVNPNITWTNTSNPAINDNGTDTQILGGVIRGGRQAILLSGVRPFICSTSIFDTSGAGSKGIGASGLTAGTIENVKFQSNATDINLYNCSGFLVQGCIFTGSSKTVELGGTSSYQNNTIRNNEGLVTENTGTATNVTLDASGIGAIAHGCDATPTVANVQCQSDNFNVRISSIDGTNINIYVFDLDNAVVTADTHDFYWEAKVR